MSKFLRSLTITEDFDGDAVTFTVRPMNFSTALRFRDASASKDVNELSKLMASALSEHTEGVAGLRDAAGGELNAADVFNNAYFTALVLAVGAKWAERSMPGN